jgi:hypothetical protein
VEKIPFETFRELKAAINQMPDEMLDNPVHLNLNYGASSRGGTLDMSYGVPGLMAHGDE